MEDCNADCFAHELASQRADSFVCYPLKKAGVRIVEEDWTLATTDVYDEVWYSTCYVYEPLREFAGLPTTVRIRFTSLVAHSSHLPRARCTATTDGGVSPLCLLSLIPRIVVTSLLF